MSVWKEIEFSKLLVDESISYGIVQPGAHSENNSVPIIRVNNIKNGNIKTDDVLKVDASIEDKYKRTRLNGGELLITVVGSVGECAIVPDNLKGWNVARAVSVAKIKSDFDTRFIKYAFKTDDIIFQMYGNTNDTVQPTLNLASLKALKFQIPTFSEQTAIASVLSSLDDKIDLLHRQNATLEKMAETLFRQWFVEEAKEEWEVGPLGDFVNIAYGKNLPTKNLLPSGYPVFGGNGQIGFFDKYIYEKPQVLVSCRGEASGVVNISLERSYVTNNSLILEIGKRPEITFEFLKYSSLNTDFRTYVSGSAQPQITIEGLYPAEFVLPPYDLIIKFTEVVRLWEQKRTNNQTQIRTLTALRETLLPKLMSGEVKVEI